MTNILPQEYKKDIVKEYRYRFVAVFFWYIVLFVVIGCVLLIPSYIMSGIVEKDLKEKADQIVLAGQEKRMKEITYETSIVNKKLQYLNEKLGAVTTVGKIAEVIISKESKTVKITGMSIERSTGKVEVSGIAQDRQSLVLFSNSIKSQKEFKDVVLPLSNLTERNNIPFSVSFLVPDLSSSQNIKSLQ